MQAHHATLTPRERLAEDFLGSADAARRDARHWDHLYATQDLESLNWYQADASESLALIEASDSSAEVLDAGGGASTLVDTLVERGRRVTVLDISAVALDIARNRLGPLDRGTTWLQAEVTQVALPEGRFGVWHDRGLFHFLTDRASREAYVAQVRHALAPGGRLVMATFGSQGPLHCCGLPVLRFSSGELQAAFGADFEPLWQFETFHRTPSGGTQHFVYGHWQRR